MKAVVQRVKNASVKVNNEFTGKISEGILVYIGFAIDDEISDLNWMAKKIPNLRIFNDENGKMNHSVKDLGLGILLVSQFTLLGSCKKGRRPSYDMALGPVEAKKMYKKFVNIMEETGLDIQCGMFQEHMEVDYLNDGPVTLILDSND